MVFSARCSRSPIPRLVSPSPIRSRILRSWSVRESNFSSCLRAAVAQPLQDPGGRHRVEQRLAGRHVPYGTQQFVAPDGLQDVPGGTRHDRVEEGLVVREGGQHQALHGVVPGADLAAHLDPAAVREPYVENRHIGARGRDPHQRVGRRTGLADHLDVVLDREHLVDATPDHFMVVEEKYADFSVSGHAVSLTYRLFPCPR
jgi:hypothetical protein